MLDLSNLHGELISNPQFGNHQGWQRQPFDDKFQPSTNCDPSANAMSEPPTFPDLRQLFAKANEEKSGDQLAGLAASSERERVAAKRKLADLTLDAIVQQPLIDPAHDDVSRLILETYDQEAFRSYRSMTVGEFREYILDDTTGEAELKRLHWAIIPEIAAAVAKIMSNKDLIIAAAKIRNITRCRNTLGEAGVLGIRVQPNHPSDDLGGILLAAFE